MIIDKKKELSERKIGENKSKTDLSLVISPLDFKLIKVYIANY